MSSVGRDANLEMFVHMVTLQVYRRRVQEFYLDFAAMLAERTTFQ